MRDYSRARKNVTLLLLAAALALAALYSLKSGAIASGWGETLAALARVFGAGAGDQDAARLAWILQEIRLPRLLLGVLVGGALAISGAVMQALFRNPMADPGLLGVSSGAALGAVCAIVFGAALFGDHFAALGVWLTPGMAFAGGLVSLTLVHRLARRGGRIDIPTMLLAGIALNAIAGALLGLLNYIADDAQLRDIIFWSLGSLDIGDWRQVGALALVVAPALPLMLRFARALNANLLGENEARHLGVDIERVKRQLIALVALVVGISVAFSGIIGFVGLLTPHLLRLVIGPDHRLLLPASVLFGATLIVLADVVARVAVAPAEIPIGIITALLGGPFFLYLLVKRGRAF